MEQKTFKSTNVILFDLSLNLSTSVLTGQQSGLQLSIAKF